MYENINSNTSNEMIPEDSIFLENNKIKVSDELLKKADEWLNDSRWDRSDHNVGYNLGAYINHLNIEGEGLRNPSNLAPNILGAVAYKYKPNDENTNSEFGRNMRFLEVMGKNKEKFFDFFIGVSPIILYVSTINKNDAEKIKLFLKNAPELTFGVTLPENEEIAAYAEKNGWNYGDLLLLLKYREQYKEEYVNAMRNNETDIFNQKLYKESLKHFSEAQPILLSLIEGYEALKKNKAK